MEKRRQFLGIIRILPSSFHEHLKKLLEISPDSGETQEFYLSIGYAIQQTLQSGSLGRREFLQLAGLVASSGILELLFPQSAHAGGIMPFGFWGAGARSVGSTDSYAPYRSLYLNAEGSIGALNAFLDSSANNFTISKNGSPVQGTFSPFSTEPGKWSASFDGNGDYLQLANSAALNLSGGAFTIECWINPVGNYSNYNVIIAKRVSGTSSTAWEFYLDITTGKLSYYNGTNYVSAAVPSSNIWNHIAAVYDGTSINLYLNGSRVLQSTVGNTEVSAPISIGYANYGSEYFNGTISNLRIIKGTALYSGASFTVPTSPLTAISGTQLLTLQDNRFVDNSSNNAGITVYVDAKIVPMGPFTISSGTYSPSVQGGSAYFNGTTDYLNLGNNSAFSVTGSSLTCEAWIYPTAFSSQQSIFSRLQMSGSYPGYILRIDSGYPLLGSSNNDLVSSIPIPLNSWSHIAYVFDGNGNQSIYVNGVRTATRSNGPTTMDYSDNLCMGGSSDGSRKFCGYISGARIVKSSTPYYNGTSFTLLTAPPSAVSNTSALLNFTNADIIDYSNKNNLSRSGNPAQGTFSPFSAEPGKWGVTFDGGSSLLSSGTPNPTSGDFTVECWIYPIPFASGYQLIFLGDSTGGFGSAINSTGTVSYGRSLTATDGNTTSSVNFNSWNHIAWVRTSNTLKIYINGVVGLTVANSTSYPSSATRLGAEAGGNTLYFTGTISNFRIVNGTGLYTTNFTVPTLPLTAVTGTALLSCQQNQFKESSVNNLSITPYGNPKVTLNSPFSPATSNYLPDTFGGSAYFNGSSDFLTVNGNSIFNFGSSDWTFEAWVYLNALPTSDAWPTHWSSHQVIAGVGTPNAGDGIDWIIGQTKLMIHSNDVQYASSAHGIKPFSWNHVAYVRSGNTLYFYVNGVAKGSVTLTGSIGIGPTTYIGCETGQGAYFNGYLSNLRVSRGTAIYTGSFTPPTSPVSNTRDTTLLLNSTNASIIDSTRKNVLARLGDVQNSTAQKKYGNSSLYFDGSGDYLEIPLSDGFGTGDITVEMWIYPTTVSGVHVFYDNRVSNSAVGIALYTNGSLLSVATGTTVLQTGGTVVANQWQHVAYTRSGSTNRLFLNGVIQSTVTNSTSYSASKTWIGNSVYNEYTQGYIDNLSVLRGKALYTTNFTPGAVYAENYQIFSYTGSSQSFTVPQGVISIRVVAVGGGGGGGGGHLGAGNAGGGGAGGRVIAGTYTVTPGASYTITIGGGGTAGAGGNAGAKGQTSSLGSLISAIGGDGGNGGYMNVANYTNGGGNGGSGGGAGTAFSNLISIITRISCSNGSGGVPTASSTYYNGGGGGGGTANTGNGGAGGSGVVYIEW